MENKQLPKVLEVGRVCDILSNLIFITALQSRHFLHPTNAEINAWRDELYSGRRWPMAEAEFESRSDSLKSLCFFHCKRRPSGEGSNAQLTLKKTKRYGRSSFFLIKTVKVIKKPVQAVHNLS